MAQQGNIAEHPLKGERLRRREDNVGSGPCLGTPSMTPPVVGDEDHPLYGDKSWRKMAEDNNHG